MNKIKETAEFLSDNGLLFEINRKVLHPLGLAMEIYIDDDDKINFILEDIEELLSMNQRTELDRRDVIRDTTDRRE